MKKKWNVAERLIFLKCRSHHTLLRKGPCTCFPQGPGPATSAQPVPWGTPSASGLSLTRLPHPILHPPGLACTFLPLLWCFLFLLCGTLIPYVSAYFLSLSSDEPSLGGESCLPGCLRFSTSYFSWGLSSWTDLLSVLIYGTEPSSFSLRGWNAWGPWPGLSLTWISSVFCIVILQVE